MKINKKAKKPLAILAVVLVAVVTFAVVFWFNYQSDINHRGTDKSSKLFIVESGDTVSSVAKELERIGLIRSARSMEIYARLNNLSSVKLGRYDLSANMTIAEILKLINSGPNVKTFNLTFLPGGTVKMAKNALIKAGFSEAEVSTALKKDYSSDFPKLFSGKPTEADLEGFFWGETHNFEKGTSVESILKRYFADFEKKIVELGLEAKFAKHNLTLYQGVTLASIVQKESLGQLDDMKAIAGVFYNRMRAGMTLGSDVTYQYIADKTGVKRAVDLDSPYNLRVKTGLTPTPIATPSLNALLSVAEPQNHQYLYFLSGDDDKTYFGRTNAEHEKNIRDHCAKKCLII